MEPEEAQRECRSPDVPNEFRLRADQELRRELQLGFDQADAEEVGDWDVEEMLREARWRHDSQPSS